jgi:hypothetical protein
MNLIRIGTLALAITWIILAMTGFWHVKHNTRIQHNLDANGNELKSNYEHK